MARWGVWILTGIGLALAIFVATCLLGLARVSPRIAVWIAKSALAAAALSVFLEIVAGQLSSRQGDG